MGRVWAAALLVMAAGGCDQPTSILATLTMRGEITASSQSLHVYDATHQLAAQPAPGSLALPARFVVQLPARTQTIRLTMSGDGLVAGALVSVRSHDQVAATMELAPVGADVLHYDSDGDGVPDWLDDCPEIANVDQADDDGGAQGNACRSVIGDGPGDLPDNGTLPDLGGGGLMAPSMLSYSDPQPSYSVGVSIPANIPSWQGGAPTQFTVQPSLPPGLSLNPQSGVIMGAPTTSQAAAQYTVTASNGAGSTSAMLSITVTAITFSATPPVHHSLYYGDHDVAARTITFSHNGTAVTCSHDGGNSYGACDTPTTLIWTLADYSASHTLKIKVTRAGDIDYVYAFALPSQAPGLQFFPCGDHVTANTTFDDFQSRINNIASHMHTICIDAGLTITSTTSQHVIGIDQASEQGAIILGIDGNRPSFVSEEAGDPTAFFINDGALTGMIFANFKIHQTQAGGAGIRYWLAGGGNAVSYVDVLTEGDYGLSIDFQTPGPTTTLYHCTLTTTGNSTALRIGSTGQPVAAGVAVVGGTISSMNMAPTIDQNGGTLSLDGTTVTSNSSADALSQVGGTATLKNGALTSTQGKGIDVSGSAKLTVTGTTVDGSGTAVSVASSNASFTAALIRTSSIAISTNASTLVLDTTTLDRRDVPGTNAAAINIKGTNTLNSSVNGNHFCDQNAAGANLFTSALANDPGGGSFTGTFSLAAQVNGGVVNACQ